MPTGVKNLISFIQCCILSSVHNMKFFSKAKSTNFCYWIVGACIFQFFPAHIKIYVLIFKFPHMRYKGRLVAVNFVVHVGFMFP